jgi:hypothetical protein
MAICLDLASSLKSSRPAQWNVAVATLNGYPKLMQVLFFPRVPSGVALRDKAVAAGLHAPAKQEKIW